MRISDWSSDVCSSDLPLKTSPHPDCVWIPLRCCMIPESNVVQIKPRRLSEREAAAYLGPVTPRTLQDWRIKGMGPAYTKLGGRVAYDVADLDRSEEHTSELQSLMRISYAVFCLKKKNTT